MQSGSPHWESDLQVSELPARRYSGIPPGWQEYSPIYNELEVGTGRSRKMEKRRGAWGAGAGVIWFIGWLFTIASPI